MDIEFDPAKDEINRAKHGIPLAIGKAILENKIGEFVDTRHASEVRMVAIATISGRLMMCVYTMRGKRARIISIRMANRKERYTWLGRP